LLDNGAIGIRLPGHLDPAPG